VQPGADVLVVAHRGASAHAPEHTYAAYDLAFEQGADVIEIDVRPMADGTFVALHDPTLERTAGDPRAVASMRPEELEELEESVRPPTLDGVLGRYGRDARYWIDMKDPEEGDESRLLEVLQRHAIGDLVSVQSFEPACVTRLSRLEGAPALGQLYRRAIPPEVLMEDLDRVAGIAVAIGRAHELIDEALMAAARERGLAVYAYTVNDEAEMERMVALGVKALISDVPDRCRRFVDGLVSAPG
jgi:glycerophosphoryl diester phosphodiesterase